MMEIIKPIIIAISLLSGLGFFFGLFLAIIARIFHVEVDPKIEKIGDILPGANCGACGYPGCAGYADAIVTKDVDINLCSPGGEEVVNKIGSILGKKATAKTKMVAKIFCLGDDAVAEKDFEFNGDEDCSTVYNYFQGEKTCKYGCLGRGNCMRVCPVGAIKRDALNRVWIDANECISCEKCLSVCPTHVIKMVPINKGYFVACSSPEPGKIVRKICKKGCIGCKICEKLTGPEKMSVENFLASVHYNAVKKSDFDVMHQASIKCPADVIVPIRNQKFFMRDAKKHNKEKV